MKKKDLKSGMIIEYRNGDRRLVCNNSLIGIYKHGNLIGYNENLNHKEDRNLDIVKIYNTTVNFTMNDLYKVESLRLLWQHPSTITKEDICNHFGIQSFEIPEVKPGMIVEHSDGEKFLVTSLKDGSLYLTNYNCWCSPINFDPNEAHTDIVKIYWPKYGTSLSEITDSSNLELVWRKITDLELIEAFGSNVTFKF